MTVSRSQRRKQLLREDILSAAHELFVRDGVSATTLEDICAHADIAHRTLFNHFASRRELVGAVAERQLRTLFGGPDPSSTPGAPTTITALFDAFAAVLASLKATDRELSEALISAASYRGSRGAGLHARMVEFVKIAVAHGDMTSSQDPEILADIIVGTLTAATAQWTSNPTYSLTEHLHRLAAGLDELLARAATPRRRHDLRR